MSLTLFFVVAFITAIALGLKLFKLHKYNKGDKIETVVYGRDLLAIGLIALGLTGSFFSLNQFQTEALGTGSGGGPFLIACPDIPNVACYTNANSGACTPLNVGTPSCKLPQNGCDGVLRSYGRCETGSFPVTIPVGNAAILSSLTFPTPFTNTPS